MINFSYIADKIRTAEFISDPFPHLEINDFLSDEHLDILLTDKQVHFHRELIDDDDLYRALLDNKYKIQKFPGCMSNWEMYKKMILNKDKFEGWQKHCVLPSYNVLESAGITFRLTHRSVRNPAVRSLVRYMNEAEFHNVLKNKFEVTKETKVISAIQKNLTGYEITPHPDIRQKCLTYLLNINRDDSIENEDVHTHLLKFKDAYKNVERYWDETDYQRGWVPWDYCNTVKKIAKNNTAIIFAPASSPPTLHAVKLDYDHKKFQRTQIYGNLNYTAPPKYPNPPIDWADRLRGGQLNLGV